MERPGHIFGVAKDIECLCYTYGNYDSDAERKKGFTIVELLIVVIIIGILAAITIVSYSSIQGRAKDARVAATISQYVDILKVYRTNHGTYPVVTRAATTRHVSAMPIQPKQTILRIHASQTQVSRLTLILQLTMIYEQ